MVPSLMDVSDDGPGNRQKTDGACSSRVEAASDLLSSSAAGHNIVNDEYASRLNQAWGPNSECTPDRPGTLRWTHPCAMAFSQPGPYEGSQTQLELCSPDHRACQYLSLIEASLLQPGRMQGHGNDQLAIVSRCESLARLSKPYSETICDLRMTLEPTNRLTQRSVIRPARSRCFQCQRLAPAACSARQWNLQDDAAFWAKTGTRREFFGALPAGRTCDGIVPFFNRPPAHPAERGIQEGKGRISEIRHKGLHTHAVQA
jgi:hypothetical protein